jgi:hypothetical protein
VLDWNFFIFQYNCRYNVLDRAGIMSDREIWISKWASLPLFLSDIPKEFVYRIAVWYDNWQLNRSMIGILIRDHDFNNRAVKHSLISLLLVMIPIILLEGQKWELMQGECMWPKRSDSSNVFWEVTGRERDREKTVPTDKPNSL